ncbi:MAG: tetratricopeptide repeat protein [Candidatus Competibacteraceae bacterium]|nr:MAG: tetratricopeptide repeat protein [Candidatus Competibacteraceae bacterium]
MTQEPSSDDGVQISIKEALALARKLHRQSQLDEAEGIYRRLLDAVPEWPDVLNLLALLRFRKKDEEEAIGLLRRAVAMDPNYADAHNNLGNLLKLQGRIDEAESSYLRALELVPEHADAWNNLGIIRRLQERPEAAEEALRRALRANERLVDAHYNLGMLLRALRRYAEAADSLQRVLALNSYYWLAYQSLGSLLYLLGRTDEAVGMYRDWLKLTPDHPVALHMLAACTGDNIPERASDHYIRTLFDAYATRFDQSLVENLHYQAPQRVAEALTRCYGGGANLDILDAGCGTGLCGPMVKAYARALTGVDLSPKMLEEARRRSVYDELIEAELTAFLKSHPAGYDAIISADTLCYFGPLADFSQAAAAALRPSGRLILTVERLPDRGETPGFMLIESGRYAHRQDYLRETLTAAGFTVDILDQTELRMEAGQPVAGLVVAARKNIAGAEPEDAPGIGRLDN